MTEATIDKADEMPAPSTTLRGLHDTRVSLQKFRIQVGNRISAIERNADSVENPVPEIYSTISDHLDAMEKAIDRSIEQDLKNWPVWDLWLKHVKGIGPSLAGQMLAMLHTPTEEKGPSSWYKAAGLAPETRPDGQSRLPRPRKVTCPECAGEKFSSKDGQRACRECGAILPEGYGRLTYYPWLRRTLSNVAESFVRSGGYYRAKYDQYKATLIEQHEGDPNWPTGRIDRVARWKMIKLFLSHLWNKWCEAIGITPRPPYALEKLGHHTFYPPPEVPAKGKI